MAWREDDLDIDGVRIHYFRRGSGPALVLAHGASDSGECWTRVAENLEGEYDVIAYDARYHGLSDAVEGPGGGADLIAFVEKLGLQRPGLMGHSMGAGSVIRACAARPDLFRCAILEDPALVLTGRGSARTPSAPRSAPDFSTMTSEQIEAAGRLRWPDWHDDEWSPWARSKKRYRPPSQGVASFSPPDAWRDSIKAVDLPALLIYGGNRERGAIVTDEVAAEVLRLNPRFRAVKIEGAGHNVRREAYDAFMAAVRGLLDENR